MTGFAPQASGVLVHELVRELGGGDADAVRLVGEAAPLPGSFRVEELASASIAAATLAVAELWAARTGAALRSCSVVRGHAAAAFRLERLMKPEGWELPPVWDPIAGDYPSRDGWVRLHTNYASHRDAATSALGVRAEKAQVAAAVKALTADEVEAAVVGRGGCAAALRTREAWADHPQGRAVASELLVARSGRADAMLRRGGPAPLSGLRVLDLTRVIAGPVGTRFLAAYGAEVLRIDPPGFEEVPALLPEMTRGKRCAFLDLRSAEGRRVFDGLVRQADVLVHGYRLGALAGLGYDAERLASLNPWLVTVQVNAYGYQGPWADRRGFDSLVQMSTGIAAGERPTPLPAQALDHATGYLVAAAACRALVDGVRESRLSLARTARLLVDLGTQTAGSDRGGMDFMESVETPWGTLRCVRIPGAIDGFSRTPLSAPGRLGRDAPEFQRS